MLKRFAVLHGRLGASARSSVRIGLVVAGSLAALITASSAAAASTPAGGAVRVWVTPGSGAVDKIVITGAIGDYGKATSINKDGKVDENGDYVKVVLGKGSFEVNAVTLNKKTGSAPPTFNAGTCSYSFEGSGPVTLFNGSGVYAGVSGTLKITEAFAGVGPLYKRGAKKGQCNMSNSAQPVAQYSSITGTGAVKFG